MNSIILNTNFLNADSIVMALTAILVIFLSISILYMVLKVIPKLIEIQVKRKARRNSFMGGQRFEQLPSGVDAAISAALFMYFNEIHDVENGIMTIKKVSKAYSPWSSKIYSMRWPLR